MGEYQNKLPKGYVHQTRSAKDRKNAPTPQTPAERTEPGNKRVKAPSGRTTWAQK